MIKNYFLTAIRNLWKNRVTAMIKIIGLAIGLSAVLLIYLFVSFERSYDRYHEKGDRIYRVAYRVNMPEFGELSIAKTGRNLSGLLQSSFPEIESLAQVVWMGDVQIFQQGQLYKESKFLFGDPSVLTMFSFPMSQGDRYSALNEPRSVVISSKIARKYFGDDNPVGKYLDDNRQLKVTGVVDVPDNSHFRFDLLASYSTIYDYFPFFKNIEKDNIDRNVYTYLLLKQNANVSDLEKKLPAFTQAHIDKGSYSSVELFLEPLEKIYLDSQSEAYLGELTLTKFTKPIIYLFKFLGLIIIGIASFNFINIAIAQIVGRTKEVSVRKIYGSKKAGIFLQFVCEYLIYSLISVILSILIVQTFLPFVNSIINRQIEVNYFEYFTATSVILFVVTFFAGAYPSFVIAGVNPVQALQSGFKGPKGNVLKSVLVVSQFSVSIILILITIYVSKQIQQFTTVNTEINTKNLLVLKMDDPKIKTNYELLKSEFLKNPNVLSVSASSNIPAVSSANIWDMKIDEGDEIPYRYISIDPGFTQNLGIKTIQGRNLTPGSQADIKTSFFLNKSAVAELGIDDPVGKNVILSVKDSGRSYTMATGRIIGIIDDYPYRPAYETSKGVIFNNDPSRYAAMFLRINPANQKETLTMIRDTWKNLFPDIPINASFLEDEIINDPFIIKLHGLQRFISAAAIFSFAIALLGLFGLSIFAARQRIKEIGIRRINGASMLNLLVLMNKKLMIMVATSIVISFPLVYLIIAEIRKLNPRSVELSALNYGLILITIVVLTILTISWHSWKAASRNPTEALRYE